MIWNWLKTIFSKRQKLLQLAEKCIVGSSREGLIIMDTEYRVLYANQIVLEKYPDIINVQDEEVYEGLVRICAEEESIYKKGEESYEIRVIKLCESGTLRGYMAWIHDMSFVNQYTNEIVALKDKAETAAKEKTEFLEHVSEEIRTPMNIIFDASEEILKQSGNSKETQEMAFAIRSQAKALLTRMEDVLIGARPEDAEEYTQKTYYTQELLESVSRPAVKQAKEHGIIYEVVLEDNLPYRMKGSFYKIQKLLETILTLAMQDAVEGNVTLQVGSKWRTGKRILLEFVITKKQVVYKEDNEELDLAIIRNRVEKLDGELIISKEGENTGMTVTLLQEIVDERPIGTITCCLDKIEDTEFTQAFLTTAKVLILDADEQGASAVCNLLKEYGVKADVLNDGEQVLKQLEEQAYDIVFMDYLMSGMDCMEMMLRIREMNHGQYQQLPLVALAATGTEGMKEDILSLGFDEYLIKPPVREEVERMMRKHLPKNKISYVDRAYL